MDRTTRRQVEEYRANEAGPLENNLIDELVAGEYDREEFIRRAMVFGVGAGAIGTLLRYVGEAEPAFGATMAPGKVGGTLRMGIFSFKSGLEPYQLREAGSLAVAGIPGEFLTFSNAKGQAVPMLASSWKPNKDLTVWTFQIRKGVKFHNGKTLTADDVVASFKQYLSLKDSQLHTAIPASLLGPEGVVKKGPYTVEFHIKSPNNAFPYLVSQTSYQAIIQPAAIAKKPGTWVGSGMIGTGPFRLKSYQANRRAEFVRFPGYWGGKAPLDGAVMTFYADPQPMILALRAGQIDLAQQLSPQIANGFKGNKKFKVFAAPLSSHNMFGLRVDQEPFRDARVRRAIALSLNRPDIIKRVLLGQGTLGNDSPFWSGYPSSDPSVHQRKQNVQLAKALLKAAGKEDLKFTITTHNQQDVPFYAQAIQAAGREAGISIDLNIMSYDDYYAAVGGGDYQTTTPWLNAPATITEYGARGAPNLYLTAAYMTGGQWNASRYANPAFDAAAKGYLGSADIATQRKRAKTLEGLLLRDTPVITAYFLNFVTAGSAKVQNFRPDGISHMPIGKTSLA